MARKSKASAEPTLFDAPLEVVAAVAPSAIPHAAEAPVPATRWTSQQQAVIEHIEGDLLVSAAAGSGKTAVLAERCARLITAGDPPPTDLDRLLVLTFTEAAAAEMRARIAEAIRQRIAGLRGDRSNERLARNLLRQSALIDRAGISTIDSFCARVLRNYFHDVGVDPAFEILDEEEARLLRDEVMDELLARYHGLPEGDPQAAPFADFYEAYGQGRDGAVRGFITSVQAMLATLKDPEEWLTKARNAYSPTGAPQTLDACAGGVADELDMLASRCGRNIAYLRQIGRGQVADALTAFRDLLQTTAPRLRQQPTAWDRIAATFSAFEFPKIRKPVDMEAEAWKTLKASTYEKFRDKFKGLKSFTFALPREKMLRDLRNLAAPLEVLLRLTRDFQAAYTAAKQQQNRLDFADLERLTLDLLCKVDSPACEDLRQRYDQILIDEFQDINPLQAAVLDALRNPAKYNRRGNLFVVGDIKQSIYGFRLAEPRLFAQREQKYAEITTHRARIHLQTNFRSDPALLKNMNELFARLLTPGVAGVDYLTGHQLHAPENVTTVGAVATGERAQLSGTPIELHLAVGERVPEETDEAEDDSTEKTGEGESAALTATQREAQMVAARITSLMQAGHLVPRKSGPATPLRYGDIAILLRGIKSRGHIYARALAQVNIPVHADMATGYFDAPEVRDTLGLLQVLDNPLQDIPLTATLLSAYGNFTHDDLARIRLAYPDKHQVPFHSAVQRYAQEQGAAAGSDGDLAQRLAGQFDLLARYRTLMRDHPLHEALAEIYQDSGITTYVCGLPAGAQRLANLQMLHRRALQFSGFRKQGLYRFLKFIERLRDADGDYGEAPVLSEASDVVRIMSIHKSKGLEFPVVIVAALAVPFNLRAGGGAVLVHRDMHIALQVVDVERNIYYHSAASKRAQREAERFTRAEELRLLYVAMTRARNTLILAGTAKRSAVDSTRLRWAQHRGALPDDVLLEGRSFLDWLIPVAAMTELGALWPDQPTRPAPLAITFHEMPAAIPPPREATPEDSLVTTLRAGRPLDAGTPDEVVGALIDRLEGHYKYAVLTELAAVNTVSELKKLDQVDAAADESAPALLADESQTRALAQPYFTGTSKSGENIHTDRDSWQTLATDRYAARGIATHRFLEALNFAAVAAPADLGAQLGILVASGRISAGDAKLVDLDDIAWFLFEQPLGRRLCTLGAGGAATPGQPRLLREIPFTYTLESNELLAPANALSAGELSLLDRPQVRGVIDVLLVSPTHAEIIDYKTDHALAVDERLPMYKKQMGYYQRAAAAILSTPVPTASLVFLAARRIETV